MEDALVAGLRLSIDSARVGPLLSALLALETKPGPPAVRASDFTGYDQFSSARTSRNYSRQIYAHRSPSTSAKGVSLAYAK
ncbi:MAG TPA: hypothetical protein VE955_08570 [Candidatus Dormibacteraeota bacterium]|nr:hypothetical protein [Candidatus Dormibacteraeota bacterium]